MKPLIGLLAVAAAALGTSAYPAVTHADGITADVASQAWGSYGTSTTCDDGTRSCQSVGSTTTDLYYNVYGAGQNVQGVYSVCTKSVYSNGSYVGYYRAVAVAGIFWGGQATGTARESGTRSGVGVLSVNGTATLSTNSQLRSWGYSDVTVSGRAISLNSNSMALVNTLSFTFDNVHGTSNLPPVATLTCSAKPSNQQVPDAETGLYIGPR